MRHCTGVGVHHSGTEDSATSSWEVIYNYHVFKNHWRSIGYHFGVEDVYGTMALRLGRPMQYKGAHAIPLNNTHMGLVLIGNFNLYAPPKHQLNVAAQAIADLARLYKFDLNEETVMYHRDVWNTSCPGKFFPDKSDFLDRITRLYDNQTRVL